MVDGITSGESVPYLSSVVSMSYKSHMPLMLLRRRWHFKEVLEWAVCVSLYCMYICDCWGM